MRRILVILLLAAALWLAWSDWRATIGAGFAYRLSSVEAALTDRAPGAAGGLFDAWRTTGIPYLWDPVGAILAGLPAALVLAGLLWITRRRR